MTAENLEKLCLWCWQKNYTLIMSLSKWWFWQMYFSYHWEYFASLLSWLWPGEVLDDEIYFNEAFPELYFQHTKLETQNFSRCSSIRIFRASRSLREFINTHVHENKVNNVLFIVTKLCCAQKVQLTCISEWWHWVNIYAHENIHAQVHILQSYWEPNVLNLFWGGNKNFTCSKALKLK